VRRPLDGEIVAGRRVRETGKTAPLAVDGRPTPSRARGMAVLHIRREGDRRGSWVGRAAVFERKHSGCNPRHAQTGTSRDYIRLELWSRRLQQPEAAGPETIPFKTLLAAGVVQLGLAW